MEFSRKEYWSGLPFPSPEDLPDRGIKPWSPTSQADSLPFELQGSQSSLFRILNSSSGISSPPLALFVVMLPKAHLISHSRMSGSVVITPSWLSGSLIFLYSSSVYSCHLFLISSASVRSLLFLSFIEPVFA